MPLTNLSIPGGFTGPGTTTYPVMCNPGGAVLFVNSSTGQDSRGRVVFPGTQSAAGSSANAQGPYGDPNNPLASVFGTNGAASLCKASRGDLIVVMAGHTENIAAAKTLPAGVTVLGLGYRNNRPTFTFTTATTAKVTMGAGSRFQGVEFAVTTAVVAVVTMLVMGAGSQVVDCTLTQANATNAATSAITVNGASVSIANTRIDATAAAGAAQAILAGAAAANLIVEGCWIAGDFSAANMVSSAALHLTNMLIKGNTFIQQNAVKFIFNLTTSSTGTVRDNVFVGKGWATAADFATNSSSVALRWFQNYGFDDGAGVVSGVLVPAVGTIA